MAHKSIDSLEKELLKAQKKVSIGSTYYHYKNPNVVYKVTDLVTDEATETVLVIYRPLYVKTILKWARPIKSFTEKIKVKGKKIQRFTFVK